LFVSDEYNYRFYLAPKLSTSSLSYKDLFLDEATDKVDACITVICSAIVLVFLLKIAILRVSYMELIYLLLFLVYISFGYFCSYI